MVHCPLVDSGHGEPLPEFPPSSYIPLCSLSWNSATPKRNRLYPRMFWWVGKDGNCSPDMQRAPHWGRQPSKRDGEMQSKFPPETLRLLPICATGWLRRILHSGGGTVSGRGSLPLPNTFSFKRIPREGPAASLRGKALVVGERSGCLLRPQGGAFTQPVRRPRCWPGQDPGERPPARTGVCGTSARRPEQKALCGTRGMRWTTNAILLHRPIGAAGLGACNSLYNLMRGLWKAVAQFLEFNSDRPI